MFFTQKLSLKFRPGLTKERVDLHEIVHYHSNVSGWVTDSQETTTNYSDPPKTP